MKSTIHEATRNRTKKARAGDASCDFLDVVERKDFKMTLLPTKKRSGVRLVFAPLAPQQHQTWDTTGTEGWLRKSGN